MSPQGLTGLRLEALYMAADGLEGLRLEDQTLIRLAMRSEVPRQRTGGPLLESTDGDVEQQYSLYSNEKHDITMKT